MFDYAPENKDDTKNTFYFASFECHSQIFTRRLCKCFPRALSSRTCWINPAVDLQSTFCLLLPSTFLHFNHHVAHLLDALWPAMELTCQASGLHSDQPWMLLIRRSHERRTDADGAGRAWRSIRCRRRRRQAFFRSAACVSWLKMLLLLNVLSAIVLLRASCFSPGQHAHTHTQQ